MKEAASIPFQFEEWRRLIYRFDLLANVPLPDWIPALNALAAHIIRVPTDLARLMWAEVSGLAADCPAVQPVFLLWQAACVDTTGTVIQAEGKQSLVAPAQLDSPCRGKRIEETAVSRARTDSAKELASATS